MQLQALVNIAFKMATGGVEALRPSGLQLFQVNIVFMSTRSVRLNNQPVLSSWLQQLLPWRSRHEWPLLAWGCSELQPQEASAWGQHLLPLLVPQSSALRHRGRRRARSHFFLLGNWLKPIRWASQCL